MPNLVLARPFIGAASSLASSVYCTMRHARPTTNKMHSRETLSLTAQKTDRIDFRVWMEYDLHASNWELSRERLGCTRSTLKVIDSLLWVDDDDGTEGDDWCLIVGWRPTGMYHPFLVMLV
ncbi:hypothetical protein FRC20_001727 [Serendipita sp. 405]|nr:hypothetical protein FRC20_001727 [Serendipita sp. 405]